MRLSYIISTPTPDDASSALCTMRRTVRSPSPCAGNRNRTSSPCISTGSERRPAPSDRTGASRSAKKSFAATRPSRSVASKFTDVQNASGGIWSGPSPRSNRRAIRAAIPANGRCGDRPHSRHRTRAPRGSPTARSSGFSAKATSRGWPPAPRARAAGAAQRRRAAPSRPTPRAPGPAAAEGPPHRQARTSGAQARGTAPGTVVLVGRPWDCATTARRRSPVYSASVVASAACGRDAQTSRPTYSPPHPTASLREHDPSPNRRTGAHHGHTDVPIDTTRFPSGVSSASRTGARAAKHLTPTEGSAHRPINTCGYPHVCRGAPPSGDGRAAWRAAHRVCVCVSVCVRDAIRW